MRGIQKFLLLVVTLFCTINSNSVNNNHFLNRTFGEIGYSVTSCVESEKGIYWIGTRYGLRRFDGEEITIYRNRENDSSSLSDDDITYLYVDSDKKLWIGTKWGGICKYIKHKDSFVSFKSDDKSPYTISNNYVTSIFEDSKKRFWITTNGGGLQLFDRKSEKFQVIDFSKINPNIKVSKQLYSVIEDSEGNLWLGVYGNNLYKFNYNNKILEKINIHDRGAYELRLLKASDNNIYIYSVGNGVWLYNPDTKDVNSILYSEKGYTFDVARVRALREVRKGILYIGTELSGLFEYNLKSEECKRLHISFNSNVVPPLDVKDIYKDHRKNVWISSEQGVYLLNNKENLFNSYEYSQKKYNKVNVIKEIDDNLLLGTNNGLYRYNKNQESEYICLKGVVIGEIFRMYDGTYWVGSTNNKGIYVYDSELKNLLLHFKMGDSDIHLPGNDIKTIYQDSNKNIWIGTQNGLCLYNKNNNGFTQFTSFPDNRDGKSISSHMVMDIVETEDYLWLATETGITKLDKFTFQTKCFHNRPGNDIRNIYRSNNFYSLIKDKEDNIWLASGSGLAKFNTLSEKFVTYGYEEGLNNINVLTVIEGIYPNIWVGTIDGISSFNRTTLEFRNYDLKNGLNGNTYITAYSGSDDKIYFGGRKDVVSLDKLGSFVDGENADVNITDFRVFNNSLYNSKNKKHKVHINNSKDITLEYYQSSFSIHFASVNEFYPKSSVYAYKLDGFDNEWSYVGERNFAIYTNVPSGKYNFYVKTSNTDGSWSELIKSVNVEIKNPWWFSLWFKSLVLIVIILIASVIILVAGREYKLRNNLKVQKIVNEEIKRINTNRINFFTNITHEFRTPLTLILGPLENMIKSGVKVKDDYLEIMQRNANRLLKLTNQILDFRKIESKSYKLQLTDVNLKDEIKRIMDSYKIKAEKLNIHYNFIAEHKKSIMSLDVDYLDKILHNLVSNAFKYVMSEGTITVKTEDFIDSQNKDYVKFSVIDNGEGISEENIDKVFQTFYTDRYKSGTGLGLTLVKHLVEGHGGFVDVKSQPFEETIFSFYLPYEEVSYRTESSTEKDIFPNSENNNISVTDDYVDYSKHVLVVEDNADMLKFITDSLSPYYKVSGVNNGYQALDLLKKENISIIISDIMMPGINGYELAKKIKDNSALKEIPFVLLSALNNEKDIKTGLELGVDDYIAKPFSIDILILKINNILKNREKFHNNIWGTLDSEKGLAYSEKEFLLSITDILSNNYQNSEYGVTELINELTLSHSFVYRKIKSITGKTIQDFINSYRLQKAHEILTSKKLSVKEVAYNVGFSDPKYFSISFKKKFGHSPSQIK